MKTNAGQREEGSSRAHRALLLIGTFDNYLSGSNLLGVVGVGVVSLVLLSTKHYYYFISTKHYTCHFGTLLCYKVPLK